MHVTRTTTKTTKIALSCKNTPSAMSSRWCHLLAVLTATLLAVVTAPDAARAASLPASDAEPSPADWPWPRSGDAEPPMTATPPPEHADAPSNASDPDPEECHREQSRCEAELALQAGRVGPGPVPGGRPGRPVCGSDNATYDNECHLKRVQCEGRSVDLAHRGKCKDHTPCLSYRRRASRAGYVSTVFLPQCQDDGSYSPLQCHEESGFCWCVTPQGRQVPKSAVKGHKPDCSRLSRPAKTRRGSGPRGSSPRAWRRQRRGCGRGERANFKNNLIKIFRAEYRRAALASETRPGPGPGPGPDMDLRVVDWKFAELDRDGDGMLRRPEYQALRSFVRNNVVPKPCARTFIRRCDMDGNKLISRLEWEACLGHEFNRTHKGGVRGGTRASVKGGRSPARDSGMRPQGPPQSPHKTKASAAQQVLQESVSTLAVQLPGFLLDNLERREEPEVTDCLTDRQAVLEEQRATSSALYVPECTEDGRYNKLQCYNSTGYCWCVHEDTGKPIPGTSAKDKRPACDSIAPVMKGCPEVRKKEFLKNLREFFKLRWQAAMNETDSSSTIRVSLEDRIATWNFLTFDKNKNKVLDRPEWKAFRQLVSEHQLLRRCGKKLPRYCDTNQDRSITISEWLDCLRTPPAVETVTVTSHVRRGPNPIESYLKDD